MAKAVEPEGIVIDIPSRAPSMLRPLAIRSGALPVRSSIVLVVAATVLGLALRIAATNGDLGLDEILSLKLVARVHSLGQVFWGISHDNNHFLNSAWIYVMGPDRPIWIYRCPAVVLGTLTVPAMARLCWKRSPAAGVFAAVLAAVALPLVDFGSEARGYAGLVLATVLAIDYGERATEESLVAVKANAPRRRFAWLLAIAVGLGMLCHLTMAYVVAVIGPTVLVRVARHERRILSTVAITARIFFPSALLMLPAAAAVAAGVIVRGGFTIGDADPFSLEKLSWGYGGMLLFMSGLPDAIPGVIGIAAALVFLAIAAHRGLVAPQSALLGLSALIVLPAAIAAARLPNVAYCRYFSVCGIVFAVLLSETLGSLWNAGPVGRRRALAALAVMVSGSLALDVEQIGDGRGSFSQTLALMTAEGSPTYFASRRFMAEALLGAAGQRSGQVAAYVSDVDFCRTPPDWYIDVGLYDPRPNISLALGPAACPATYRIRQDLSGVALVRHAMDPLSEKLSRTGFRPTGFLPVPGPGAPSRPLPDGSGSRGRRRAR